MGACVIGMGITDLEGIWREVNPAIERMSGQEATALIGRSAFDCLPPDDVPSAREQLAGLVAGQIATIDERKRYLRSDGESAWMHANVSMLRDPGGAPQYLLMQWRDVSAEHDAQIANRQLQLFVDAATHDLRAPLRSIESFASLLAHRAGDALDPTSQEHLTRIQDAAKRMSSLLAALSDLSGATRANLKYGPVDISLLADWVAAELQDADPERKAEIMVQPGLMAHGDEHLLKLLLVQLLHNAWKFSRDQPAVWIEVTGRVQGETLELHVRDHGGGFDEHYAHKLFEPFQRLHGPDDGGGHGLGLAIAHRVVDRHGGRIQAQSEPGAGATFHLELPAARARERNADT
ncbi:PAS domain-containing sensor histidine kinase [Lysobacter sp. A286]